MVTGRSRGSRVGWLRLLVAWTLVGGQPFGLLAAAVLTEHEAKSVFLYHCGWFVEWPATTVQGGAQRSFIIGVFGANPFGNVLDTIMRDKTIREYPVVIKYYQRIEDAVSSHILFISAAEEARLASILAGLAGTSVLTVSDLEGFAERGGMITLRIVDKKVHFDINVEATGRTGLKLSSQLLKLARVIYGTPRARE